MAFKEPDYMRLLPKGMTFEEALKILNDFIQAIPKDCSIEDAIKNIRNNITWQDIEAIVNIADDYANEIVVGEEDWPGREKYYQEILNRYEEWKEQKQLK